MDLMKLANSREWWDSMSCGQQREYLKIHPDSSLHMECKPEDDDGPSPLNLKQINLIQAEAIKRYHKLRSQELGYDPGPALDLEWVRLHAKRFRDLLREHNLSK